MTTFLVFGLWLIAILLFLTIIGHLVVGATGKTPLTTTMVGVFLNSLALIVVILSALELATK